MVLKSPHHETSSKAHDAILDVDHARLAPGLEDPVHRPATVEVLDVGTEKPPRLPPRSSAQDITARWHQDTRVKAPAQPPERIRRHEKVQAGQHARRSEDARQLAQRR